jgi:hypothetical protein
MQIVNSFAATDEEKDKIYTCAHEPLYCRHISTAGLLAVQLV